MTVTKSSIHEIAPQTYRINTPMPDMIPGGFSFNQYLVLDEQPLLFHTGPRGLFPVIREQIESLIPLSSLRYIAFSHVESDECGSLSEFLAAAPLSRPVCSDVAAMVSVADMVDVEPLGMADGQTLSLGSHQLIWQSAPHLPHGWECGYLFDTTTGTLFCGDLFTQPGIGKMPLTSDDILAPSEAFRAQVDYFSHSPDTGGLLEKLAGLDPSVLACMHGSAWSGNGAALLRRLGTALTAH
ncbi:MAG TPA: FprA family A-type flavoprotein [Gammaproteobacteria bacterium]|nr:FprA family A-type flavoprotein [Gammaproteobacteria bacterium]